MAQTAAQNREVLSEREHGTAIHGAISGHDAVTGNARLVQAEIGATVNSDLVDFDEAACIEQFVDTLASRQETLGVALGNSFLAADARFAFRYRQRSPDRSSFVVAGRRPGLIEICRPIP